MTLGDSTMTETVNRSYPPRLGALAFLMNDQGITVESLVEATGLHKRTIGRILKGESVQMSSLAPVAKALGASPNDIAHVHQSNGQCPDPPQTGTNKPKFLLRFSVEVEVPYVWFCESGQIEKLRDDMKTAMKQVGDVVVESCMPGSVKIVFVATDAGDVDRFFSAVSAGEFKAWPIKNVQRLGEDDAIVDRGVDTMQSITGLPDAGSLISNPGLQIAKQIVAEPDKLSAIAKGAAAGAVIGTVVPIVGTAIGAVIGGFFGAWAAKDKPKPAPPSTDANPPKAPNRSAEEAEGRTE
jgi:hypothetical protein